MNSTRFDRGRTREERTDDTPPRAKISERLDRPASSLLALPLYSLSLLSSSPLLTSFFPFLALDFPLCSSVLFSSRPFSLLKDLSSRSSVRFNFYEHLLPRSLVIACLAVTLRPTLPPGTDRPRFQRTVVASRSVECFFLSLLSFLPFFSSFRPPTPLARLLPLFPLFRSVVTVIDLFKLLRNFLNEIRSGERTGNRER